MISTSHKDIPLKICILPGDGIGKEVIEAALPIFDCLEIPIQMNFGEIGWECWRKEGNPIPKKTWELIERVDTVLLGAITSKPLLEAEKELPLHLQGTGIEYVSPVIQLRQRLGLFANVRPIFNILGQEMPYRFTVIRENTEGLYAGLDFPTLPKEILGILKTRRPAHANWQVNRAEEASCAIRLQTDLGLKRLFKFAFQYAQDRGFKKLTFADKPNVLRYSGNFARERLQEISKQYPNIIYDIQNIDAVALQLVRRPEQYEVIVAENMFGDILSDLGAGIMGGLGLAPSANIGEKKSYFEPVHGSSPRHAGLNKANPAALFLTIACMLEHFNFFESAKNLENAVKNALTCVESLTYDLDGQASTQTFAEEVVRQYQKPSPKKMVNFLAIGTELSQGKVLNTTSAKMAAVLAKEGVTTRQHRVIADDDIAIRKTIKQLLNSNDVLIVTGGLGPTSDDKTRFSLSEALKLPLEFDALAWQNIQDRLNRFNIPVNDSNRQQALFPKGSYRLDNLNGTAAGFLLEKNQQLIFVLPGPPAECLPMFNREVLPRLRQLNYGKIEKRFFWKLLGALESDICEKINSFIINLPVLVEYCWDYPYLNITLVVKSTIASENLSELLNNINEEFKTYFVTDKEDHDAVTLMIEKITQQRIPLLIYDSVTKGLLESALKTPATHLHVNFLTSFTKENDENAILVKTEGLEEYWQAKSYTGTTRISCHIYAGGDRVSFATDIPYRNHKVREYAVAYICRCLVYYYKNGEIKNVRNY